jgi:hypothetical protein
MRLYFILAFIYKAFMVWPGANNQLDYNTVPDILKYYIYTNRCLKKKLSFHSLKACLINLYKTEKMIAVLNQRIAEFQLHWSTFEKLFEDIVLYIGIYI